jgi:oligoribonuclease
MGAKTPSPEAMLSKSELNLVWLDMEMTGLDPERERIIEIAVVVTDSDCATRIEGPVFAVHQSDALLDAMDAWNKNTHGKSGLIERVRASAVTEAQAEQATLDFLKQYVPPQASPLCGNSVHQDRRFLVRYMPRLEAFFHYRNLDVSTLKELARRWRPDVYKAFKKRQEHTALADIHESIDELLHYRDGFLRLAPAADAALPDDAAGLPPAV